MDVVVNFYSPKTVNPACMRAYDLARPGCGQDRPERGLAMRRIILALTAVAMLGLSGCFYSTGVYYESGYHGHHHHHHGWGHHHYVPCY